MQFLKCFVVGVLVYIMFVQFLSHIGYLFCKQHKGKSTKECQNIACSKGRECPYNSFYNEEE